MAALTGYDIIVTHLPEFTADSWPTGTQFWISGDLSWADRGTVQTSPVFTATKAGGAFQTATTYAVFYRLPDEIEEKPYTSYELITTPTEDELEDNLDPCKDKKDGCCEEIAAALNLLADIQQGIGITITDEQKAAIISTVTTNLLDGGGDSLLSALITTIVSAGGGAGCTTAAVAVLSRAQVRALEDGVCGPRAIIIKDSPNTIYIRDDGNTTGVDDTTTDSEYLVTADEVRYKRWDYGNDRFLRFDDEDAEDQQVVTDEQKAYVRTKLDVVSITDALEADNTDGPFIDYSNIQNAPDPGADGDFINNSTTQQTTANFNIDGQGQIGGTLRVGTTDNPYTNNVFAPSIGANDMDAYAVRLRTGTASIMRFGANIGQAVAGLTEVGGTTFWEAFGAAGLGGVSNMTILGAITNQDVRTFVQCPIISTPIATDFPNDADGVIFFQQGGVNKIASKVGSTITITSL